MSLMTHLWQSTLCACIAALLAFALRRASARARHSVWLFASIKFLIPFSALVLAGGYVGMWTSAFAMSDLSLAVRRIGETLPRWTLDVAAGPAAALELSGIGVLTLALAWASGAAALSAWRWKQWRCVSRLARAATQLESGREVEALQRVTTSHGHGRIGIFHCQSNVEPGILGIIRPILLWPAGLSDRLTNDELDAVLRHELSHVARRDNLSALLHSIVETVFWFHPAVWWIGSRLIEERERACDEDVVRMGTEERSYAESILKVCGFCLRAPATFLAGVGGSHLTERIERILSGSRPGYMRSTRLLLGAAAIAAAGVPLGAGMLNAHREMALAAPGSPQEQTVYRPGNGVTAPRLVREVKPQYTREAMAAKIEGIVRLEAVVLESGDVGDVTVTGSLDAVYGLDDAAVEALKQWRFVPGTKDKKPVAVLIEVEMSFTLK
jgi:TonB family protein